MNKYTIELVKEMFNKAGYDLITNEYKNVNQVLEYICRKHLDKGIQKTTLKEFLTGTMLCVYCKYDNGLPYNKPWPDDIIAHALDKLNCDFVKRYSKNGTSIIQFICREHPEKGIQETNWTSIRLKKKICKVCNGKGRTTEDFIIMMSKINPTIKIKSEYNGANERIKCECLIDGYEWEPIAYNLLSGYGCPLCGNRSTGESKRTTGYEKILKLNQMHPDIEFLSVPVLSTDYVHCRCKICGHEWWATYANLTKHTKPTGCPHCSVSNSEKEIIRVLNNWNIKFTTQYTFDDLKDIHKLPFDFYLLDSGVLIEFDGEHHYYPVNRYRSEFDDGILKANKDFEMITKHDDMKDCYCYEHSIPLIRIPYWHRDDLEYFLFDEFVKNKVIYKV